MNLQDFKQWAKRKLGEGPCGVRIELDDKAIEQGLQEAKEWFNAFVGLYKEASFSMAAGQSDYDLAAVAPRIDYIAKVWFPNREFQIDYSMMYPGFLDIQGFPYDANIWRGAGYPQTTIVQSLQALESTARVLSADLNFEFVYDRTTEPITRMLRVLPQPKQSGTVVYLYRIDPEDIELKHYSQRDLWMVREYAMASVKYSLGRIRGKYTSGLPAAGGDRTLDGEALIAEAREDMIRLEEKILSYQGPIMPTVG